MSEEMSKREAISQPEPNSPGGAPKVLRRWRLLILLVAVGIALAFPFSLGLYTLRVVDLLLINTIAVLGLYFVVGLTGQVSFATAAFWAVGAYVSALLELKLQWPFEASILAAVVAAAILAYLVGVPLVRLTSHYFSFATIGVTLVTFMVLMNWNRVTGGANGLVGVPFAQLFGYQFQSDKSYYYLLVATVAVAALAARWITRSWLGRSFLAIKGSEVAAACVGINVDQTKAYALTLSAVYAAVSGVLYAHLMSYLSPDPFTFDQSVVFLVMLMVGGMNSVWGAITGAAILTILPEWLRFLKDYYLLVYGIGVVFLMVFMPYGIAGLVRRWVERWNLGGRVDVDGLVSSGSVNKKLRRFGGC